MSSSSMRILASAVLMVTALSMPFAVPAFAQAQSSGPADLAPTMLVLDASGSMTEPADGGTRMDAARRAVHTVVDAAPADAKVGLTAYGANTGSSEAEKAAGCQDVSVLRQVQTIDKPGIKSAVDGLRPRGYTPIGKALRTAADSLPKEGPRSIVLVSDGIDTCAPPDPCEIAKTLSQQGTSLVVHAVGFGVDAQARGQLECIAHSTGGTYTDAPDSGSLEQKLPRVTTSAMRNYQPAGVPVRGTVTLDGAPVLAPGQYLDNLPVSEPANPRGGHGIRSYLVDVSPGATLYFSATLAYPRSRNATPEFLHAQIYGKDGQPCDKGYDVNSGGNTDSGALTAQVQWDTAAPGNAAHCSGPGRYGLSIERSTGRTDAAAAPLEVLIGEEPPVDAGSLPTPAPEQVRHTDPGGPEVPVAGGGSFGTASRLPGPGTYTDRLRFGEVVFFKVRVEWGQALTAQVRYGDAGAGTGGAVAEISRYSPFRKYLSWDDGLYPGSEFTLPQSVNTARSPAVPVEYRNRELAGSNDRVAAHSVAGDYYISVKLGQLADGQRPDVAVPVRLSVSVSGQAHPGPAYQFTSDRQRSGVFGEARQGGTVATVPAGATRGSVPAAVVVGGGVAAVLLAAGAVVLVLRRRSTR